MSKPEDSMDTGDTGENSVRIHPFRNCECYRVSVCGISYSHELSAGTIRKKVEVKLTCS